MPEQAVAQHIVDAVAAAAVIVTVRIFIAFLREERLTRAQDAQRCHDAHAAVAREAAQGLREASAAIRECARAHGVVTQALALHRLHEMPHNGAPTENA